MQKVMENQSLQEEIKTFTDMVGMAKAELA